MLWSPKESVTLVSNNNPRNGNTTPFSIDCQSLEFRYQSLRSHSALLVRNPDLQVPVPEKDSLHAYALLKGGRTSKTARTEPCQGLEG